MEPKILLDAEFAQVTFTPSIRLGKITWKRKPTADEYKKGFSTLLEYAQNEELVGNFMSDIRNQGVVAPENRKWFETEMLPAAIDAGLKRAAVIFDGNIFKKYYLNILIGVSNKFGLPLKLFNSEEEALKWIHQFELEKAENIE